MLQFCPGREPGGSGRRDDEIIVAYVFVAPFSLNTKPANVTILSRAVAGRGWARGEWTCLGQFHFARFLLNIKHANVTMLSRVGAGREWANG